MVDLVHGPVDHAGRSVLRSTVDHHDGMDDRPPEHGGMTVTASWCLPRRGKETRGVRFTAHRRSGGGEVTAQWWGRFSDANNCCEVVLQLRPREMRVGMSVAEGG
jgi:hypothetical protein